MILIGKKHPGQGLGEDPQEDKFTLTSGSTIFCHTDGPTEQKSTELYYRDRPPDVFFQNVHLPAHLVTQAVLEDFRMFNNGSL